MPVDEGEPTVGLGGQGRWHATLIRDLSAAIGGGKWLIAAIVKYRVRTVG